MFAGSLVGVALEISMPRSISGVAADVSEAEAPDALVAIFSKPETTIKVGVTF